MQNGSLDIGVPFQFGAMRTTEVLAILAVDTNHVFAIQHILRHSEATSDIRAEFES